MNPTILTTEDFKSFNTNVCKACLRALARDFSDLPLSEVVNPCNRGAEAVRLARMITMAQDELTSRGINPDTVA